MFTGRRSRKGNEYDPACNVKWLDDEELEAFVSRSFLSGHTTCCRYNNSRQLHIQQRVGTLWISTIGRGLDRSLPGFLAKIVVLLIPIRKHGLSMESTYPRF